MISNHTIKHLKFMADLQIKKLIEPLKDEPISLVSLLKISVK